MRERIRAHEEVGRFDIPVHKVARVNEFDEGELLGLKKVERVSGMSTGGLLNRNEKGGMNATQRPLRTVSRDNAGWQSVCT